MALEFFLSLWRLWRYLTCVVQLSFTNVFQTYVHVYICMWSQGDGVLFPFFSNFVLFYLHFNFFAITKRWTSRLVIVLGSDRHSLWRHQGSAFHHVWNRCLSGCNGQGMAALKLEATKSLSLPASIVTEVIRDFLVEQENRGRQRQERNSKHCKCDHYLQSIAGLKKKRKGSSCSHDFGILTCCPGCFFTYPGQLTVNISLSFSLP